MGLVDLVDQCGFSFISQSLSVMIERVDLGFYDEDDRSTTTVVVGTYSQGDRYVILFYENQNVFVFEGPFCVRYVKKRVNKNVQGNVQMHLISQCQTKPDPFLVEM